MSKFKKLVEVTIDSRDINFNAEELAKIIMSKEDCDYDADFLNAYFQTNNWISLEELEDIASKLTPEALDLIKRLVKIDV